MTTHHHQEPLMKRLLLPIALLVSIVWSTGVGAQVPDPPAIVYGIGLVVHGPQTVDRVAEAVQLLRRYIRLQGCDIDTTLGTDAADQASCAWYGLDGLPYRAVLVVAYNPDLHEDARAAIKGPWWEMVLPATIRTPAQLQALVKAQMVSDGAAKAYIYTITNTGLVTQDGDAAHLPFASLQP